MLRWLIVIVADVAETDADVAEIDSDLAEIDADVTENDADAVDINAKYTDKRRNSVCVKKNCFNRDVNNGCCCSLS